MTNTKLRSPIRLFVSDLDGTVLPFEDRGGALAFTTWWDHLPPAKRPLLCYSTGRLCADARAAAAAAHLPLPDYLIGGVGTSLTDRTGQTVAGFQERFKDGWDRSLVQEVMAGMAGICPQPARFQSPFKSSWYLIGAGQRHLDELMAMLTAVELRVRIIYSSDRDLDIVPLEAGKGRALDWLCGHLGIAGDAVVVAGDTENDLAMFHVPGVRGIVVANARPGLVRNLDAGGVHHACASEAAGVIEGLEYFGLGAPPTSRRSSSRRTP